jgi:uncharacterized surface protein with fasciclin (FAS1) repeats
MFYIQLRRLIMAKIVALTLSTLVMAFVMAAMAQYAENDDQPYHPFGGKEPGHLESGDYSSGYSTGLAEAKPLENNIMSKAAEMRNLENFTKIAEYTGRDEILRDYRGPYTIFAPSDEAFAKLPKGEVSKMFQNGENLNDFLEYMVVKGNYSRSNLKGIKSLITIQGENLSVDNSNGLKIGGASVTEGDIEASNGIIHVLETVIRPPPKVSASPSIRDVAVSTAQSLPPDPWLAPEIGATRV